MPITIKGELTVDLLLPAYLCGLWSYLTEEGIVAVPDILI